MPRKSEFLASLHCLNGRILCSLSDLKSFSFGMIGILNHSLAEKACTARFYARKTLRGPNLNEGLSLGFPPFPAQGLESSPRGLASAQVLASPRGLPLLFSAMWVEEPGTNCRGDTKVPGHHAFCEKSWRTSTKAI